MKKNYSIKHNRIFNLDSATVQHRMFKIRVIFQMLLFSFSGYAQFITIKLDVPTKTGQSEIVPFEMIIKPGRKTGLQMLDGTGVLCISGVENFQVLATLSHSDSLHNEMGNTLPFSASLAFSNDGNSKPPGKDADHQASFPLSNCGRIIENIKNSPQELQAYIFIHATAVKPQSTKSTYMGFINFNIEYN